MFQQRKTRKTRWPVALLLGALLIASALSACSPNASSDPLLAGRVDGDPITLASYQRILAVYTAIDARQEVLAWQIPEGRKLLAGEQQSAFDFLVNLRLMRKELTALHIPLPRKSIDDAQKALQANIDLQRQQLKTNPDPNTAALLEQLTPDALAIYAEQEAAQKALLDKLQVPTVQVRGIIVASREEAEKYEQQAQQGVDFADLAKKYSLDKESGARGGDLGTVYVGEFGQVDPTFDNAVFTPGAHPGKYVITPFQGQYALLEVTNPAMKPIKAVTDQQLQQAVFAGWLKVVVRPQAKIERYVALS